MTRQAFYKSMSIVQASKTSWARDAWLDWLFDAEMAMLRRQS